MKIQRQELLNLYLNNLGRKIVIEECKDSTNESMRSITDLQNSNNGMFIDQ